MRICYLTLHSVSPMGAASVKNNYNLFKPEGSNSYFNKPFTQNNPTLVNTFHNALHCVHIYTETG